MVDAGLVFGIMVCVVLALFFGLTWLLKYLGVGIPDQIMKLLWVIVILVICLLAWRTFSPILGVRL